MYSENISGCRNNSKCGEITLLEGKDTGYYSSDTCTILIKLDVKNRIVYLKTTDEIFVKNLKIVNAMKRYYSTIDITNDYVILQCSDCNIASSARMLILQKYIRIALRPKLLSKLHGKIIIERRNA